MKIKKPRLVHGVGINDLYCETAEIVNGKKKQTHIYNTWQNMLRRCYNKKDQELHPTYIFCYVCDEWLKLSGFKRWYESYYKEDGWQIDKDLLMPGNKEYAPEKCVFVSRKINMFTTEGKASRSEYMIGCCWHNQAKKYWARCSNPFTDKCESLGFFNNEIDAHLAWKARKHEIACQLADTVKDDRLAEALRVRYL